MWNEREPETLPFTADEWARIGQFKRMTDVAFVAHLNSLTHAGRGAVAQLLERAQGMEAAEELGMVEMHNRTAEHLGYLDRRATEERERG